MNEKNEGNQIHNFISSSGSGTVINYGSGSGSDFLTGYGSGYGSGSTSQKVTVPTVPVPVPQHCCEDIFNLRTERTFCDWVRESWISERKLYDLRGNLAVNEILSSSDAI